MRYVTNPSRNRQTPDRSKAQAKIGKLAKLAQELRRGESFSITRLTVLKSLCEDPVAAARFGLCLTDLAKGKAKRRYRPLIDHAIREIRSYIRRPSGEYRQSLFDALEALEQSQNEFEHHHWADVRIIHSREALLAEHTLRCITRPWESAYWGYRLGRQYAERYDPRYGTGLIPTSTAAVEDIVKFWSRHCSRKVTRRKLEIGMENGFFRKLGDGNVPRHYGDRWRGARRIRSGASAPRRAKLPSASPLRLDDQAPNHQIM